MERCQRDKELTIGVIGGMGPYATLALFKALLDNTPAKKDWDHPRILIDTIQRFQAVPVLFYTGRLIRCENIIRCAEGLRAAGADFMIMPCSSAHYFLPQVRAKTDVQFIDMIEETSRLVVATGCTRVGVLGGEVTVRGKICERWLEQAGVNVLHVTDDEQRAVRKVIEEVKLNAVSHKTCASVQDLIDRLVARGAEVVILACTELPLAMQGVMSQVKIIDSLDALAKAAVIRAKKGAVHNINSCRSV